MNVAVLGSGSGGNATLVEANGTRILVDAGFSGRDLARRLRAIRVEPESLAGIVITHEHGDHTRGMGVLARRFDLPLYLTDITRHSCSKLLRGGETIHAYSATRPFRIGPIEVQPFLTVHDAADPVAVTVRDVEEDHKLGVATDLGRPTQAVKHALAGCHMLILEANHDENMLWRGPYPWSVKQRIASSHGHLSNEAAARFAAELYHEDLHVVALAHLSEHCNEPDLARNTIASALERCGFDGTLIVVPQDRPIDPVDIASLRRRAAPAQTSLF